MLVNASDGGGGGGGGEDFWSMVSRGIDNATRETGIAYDRLMEALAKQVADDDGDGVMNFQDELKGWDDGVFKSRSDNGQILAEVRPGFWKLFDPDGNATSAFYSATPTTFTDGGLSGSVGLQAAGGNISFTSGDSTVFTLVVIDPPAGI